VNNSVNHEKSLSMVVSELKLEAREFLQTRLQILKKELGTKVSVLKLAVPLFAVALALFWVGFLAITALFVMLIASAFGGAAGWMWAFLIVGGVYFVIGGICAGFAWMELKQRSLVPKHTLQVLKQDQVWLRNEAKSQAA
jgi:hypothetical protein